MPSLAPCRSARAASPAHLETRVAQGVDEPILVVGRAYGDAHVARKAKAGAPAHGDPSARERVHEPLRAWAYFDEKEVCNARSRREPQVAQRHREPAPPRRKGRASLGRKGPRRGGRRRARLCGEWPWIAYFAERVKENRRGDDVANAEAWRGEPLREGTDH